MGSVFVFVFNEYFNLDLGVIYVLHLVLNSLVTLLPLLFNLQELLNPLKMVKKF